MSVGVASILSVWEKTWAIRSAWSGVPYEDAAHFLNTARWVYTALTQRGNESERGRE